ncbi:MAG: 4Fe-4S dicluster domain-containing protein [Candidatus Aminicenantes bacterium]|nr:4Fe-4S dicluster domain-containing protein [Candidatus Aminicenantes bacterium]
MVNLEELKSEIKRVLGEGKVKYFIGYRRSTGGLPAAPFFMKETEDVERLIWDPTCIANLTRFLDDEKKRKARQKEPDTRPIGIIVKGCDSRAINVLLQEEFIKREDVYIVGVSCEHSGMVDEKKLAAKMKGKAVAQVDFAGKDNFAVTAADGEKTGIPAAEVLAGRCVECKVDYPVVRDVTFGEELARSPGNAFKSVEKIEAMSVAERWDFWKEQFDKCIRCYACRSVCPMCYCDECVVDTINFAVTAQTGAKEKAQKIKWIEKSPATSENFFYHMVRAMHLAGRCVDCGECERVCPVDIPLRFLNKKMEKEAKELFDYDVGMNPELPSLVSSFRDEDAEDFIR